MAVQILRSLLRYRDVGTIWNSLAIHTKRSPSFGYATEPRLFSTFTAPSFIALAAPRIPSLQPRRGMARPAFTRPFVTDCVMLNLQLFDKIDPDRLKVESNFHSDLGLDSLDHVEIIMAIEDEFGFEIPDMDAQRLLTPKDIIQYVCDRNDIFGDLDYVYKAPPKPGVHSECEEPDPWADVNATSPKAGH